MKRMHFQTTVRIILSTTFAPVLSTAHALADDSSLTTWNVSADGSDANPGSAMKPFRTITRGAEAAKPGDTVLVHPGVYRERVSPPRGGAPGKPITYRADKLGTVFIRGSEPWNPAWKAEGAGILLIRQRVAHRRGRTGSRHAHAGPLCRLRSSSVIFCQTLPERLVVNDSISLTAASVTGSLKYWT